MERKQTPAAVVARDKELRTAEAGAGTSLCELRWIWTSKSPKAAEARRKAEPDDHARATQEQYAADTGVTQKSVSMDATAWELLQEIIPQGYNLSVTDARRLAMMKKTRRAAFLVWWKAQNEDSVFVMNRQRGWHGLLREVDHEVKEAKAEFEGGGGDPADFDAVPVAERAAEVILSEVEIVRDEQPELSLADAALEVVRRRAAIRRERDSGNRYSEFDLPVALANLVKIELLADKAVKELSQDSEFSTEQKEALKEVMGIVSQSVSRLAMAVEGVSTDLNELVASLTGGGAQ